VIEVRGADHVELRGLSVEGGSVGIVIAGGAGHRLENVDLRGSWQGALQGRGAQITIAGRQVVDVGKGSSASASASREARCKWRSW